MTGHAPDFGMLMIGSNAGIVGMTKEHLFLALASGIVSVRYLITMAGCLAKLKEMTVMSIIKKCNINFVKMYSKWPEAKDHRDVVQTWLGEENEEGGQLEDISDDEFPLETSVEIELEDISDDEVGNASLELKDIS